MRRGKGKGEAREKGGMQETGHDSRKQHAADMQICKSTHADNFQPNQICNCSRNSQHVFLSFSLTISLSLSLSLLLPLGCLTNFVNLYLPRAAHTNNPRNRLGQQCSNSNKQLQKVTVILGKVLLQVPLPYHDPDPGRESCLVYC